MSTVLFVQPDPALLDEWSTGLRVDGYDVVAVTGFRDAILHVREGGIDVVLVDPYDGRSGITELVQAMEKLPDTPPLILVSALPNAPELSARFGAAGFLPKPCDADEVVALVARVTGSGVRAAVSGPIALADVRAEARAEELASALMEESFEDETTGAMKKFPRETA